MGFRILVVGGAGDVGSYVAEDLARSEEVERVTIADLDGSKAARLAESIVDAQAPVDAMELNATASPRSRLVSAFQGYDVVASAAGPFYRLEPVLVRAAIEAGVDYISICDEWAPAEHVLEAYHQPARSKGCTIVTGVGASPGLTNLAVALLAGLMDEATTAEVSVSQPLDAGGGAAVMHHLLFILSGRPPVWREGKRREIRSCRERRRRVFPLYGTATTWNLGHSEPVTLPRDIPSLRDVSFRMGFEKGSALLIWPARIGLFSLRGFRRLAFFVVSELSEWLGSDADPSPGAVRVDVWGKRGGQPAHEMLCGVGQMRQTTGIALSIGCLMLARGELTVSEGGVFAPEGCFEPEIFLSRAGEKGITSYRDVEQTDAFQFAANPTQDDLGDSRAATNASA